MGSTTVKSDIKAAVIKRDKNFRRLTTLVGDPEYVATVAELRDSIIEFLIFGFDPAFFEDEESLERAIKCTYCRYMKIMGEVFS